MKLDLLPKAIDKAYLAYKNETSWNCLNLQIELKSI